MPCAGVLGLREFRAHYWAESDIPVVSIEVIFGVPLQYPYYIFG